MTPFYLSEEERYSDWHLRLKKFNDIPPFGGPLPVRSLKEFPNRKDPRARRSKDYFHDKNKTSKTHKIFSFNDKYLSDSEYSKNLRKIKIKPTTINLPNIPNNLDPRQAFYLKKKYPDLDVKSEDKGTLIKYADDKNGLLNPVLYIDLSEHSFRDSKNINGGNHKENVESRKVYIMMKKSEKNAERARKLRKRISDFDTDVIDLDPIEPIGNNSKDDDILIISDKSSSTKERKILNVIELDDDLVILPNKNNKLITDSKIKDVKIKNSQKTSKSSFNNLLIDNYLKKQKKVVEVIDLDENEENEPFSNENINESEQYVKWEINSMLNPQPDAILDTENLEDPFSDNLDLVYDDSETEDVDTEKIITDENGNSQADKLNESSLNANDKSLVSPFNKKTELAETDNFKSCFTLVCVESVNSSNENQKKSKNLKVFSNSKYLAIGKYSKNHFLKQKKKY